MIIDAHDITSLPKVSAAFIEGVTKNSELGKLSKVFDTLPRNILQHRPWSEYKYHPLVSFVPSYCIDSILIKYFVTEKNVRAIYNYPNEPVYKDTCVEFFISFDDSSRYYNLEFNCVGACLAAYGAVEGGRRTLSDRVISNVRSQTSIKPVRLLDDEPVIDWEILVSIPLDVFVFHKIFSLRNSTARVNFYKCGDDLPEPHFLSWSDIRSPFPNFHLPEFFGEMVFI